MVAQPTIALCEPFMLQRTQYTCFVEQAIITGLEWPCAWTATVMCLRTMRRPTSVCSRQRPVPSQAAAAETQSLYRRTNRRTSDRFSFGVVAASWCSSRRGAASRGSGQLSRWVGIGRFDHGRDEGTTKNHVCCGRRGHADTSASSVRRWLSRATARCPGTYGTRLADRFTGSGCSTSLPLSMPVLNVIAVGQRWSVAAAPLCGLFIRR